MPTENDHNAHEKRNCTRLKKASEIRKEKNQINGKRNRAIKNKYIVWAEVAATLLLGEFLASSAEDAEQQAWQSSMAKADLHHLREVRYIAPRIDFLIVERVENSKKSARHEASNRSKSKISLKDNPKTHLQ
jgi:hypothetical protein